MPPDTGLFPGRTTASRRAVPASEDLDISELLASLSGTERSGVQMARKASNWQHWRKGGTGTSGMECQRARIAMRPDPGGATLRQGNSLLAKQQKQCITPVNM